MQFGLKDLTELPSMEDFQDLAGGVRKQEAVGRRQEQSVRRSQSASAC